MELILRRGPNQRIAASFILVTAELEMTVAEAFTCVVRIWREPATVAGEQPEYRGEIKDVMSGETRYFRLMDGLIASILAFIERRDGELP